MFGDPLFWVLVLPGLLLQGPRPAPRSLIGGSDTTYSVVAIRRTNAPRQSFEQCPAYSVPQEIVSAVHDKERREEAQFAQLVIRGVPTVVTTTGGQGGMNATFLEALKANGGPGSDIRTASGTIPGYVHPPAEPSPGFSTSLSQVR